MGLIQGLTEFLPVSSSGHLALFKILFHVDTDTGLLFDVLLHIGTLAAVFAVYYKDIFPMIKEFVCMIIDCVYNLKNWIGKKRGKDKGEYRRIVCNSYRKFVLLIVISTIPTAILGYVGQDFITMASEILFIPGLCLIITAVLLLICDMAGDGRKKPKQATYANAFVVGIAQGFATLPGLSRSGTTITACVLCGFERRFAVKYSFILSIPAILGALVLELGQVGNAAVSSSEIRNYVIGMVIAAVVGYICIKTMLVIVHNKKFKYFSVYCLIIGVLSVCGYAFLMA